MTMFELPPDATEPQFVELLAYWRRKSPAGRLPGRQHLDPVELPRSLLPTILLFEVDRREGLRFIFRLAGTAFTELVGHEVTGLYLDQFAPPERVAPVAEALRTIVEQQRPCFLAGPLTLPSRDFRWVKRLGVPLARDGETVDMVLSTFLPMTAGAVASAA